MLQDGQIYIGTSRNPDDSLNKGEYLELKFGNRHGLITGATGTGKTVTLQVLAEGFRRPAFPSSAPISRATFPVSPRRAKPRTGCKNVPNRSASRTFPMASRR